MKYVYVFLMVSFLFACNNKPLKNKIKDTNFDILQIHLKEFDFYFLPDSCNCKMNMEIPGNTGRLKIDMQSCMGKMTVQEFDSSGKLVAEGYYAPSLDTLKKYPIGKSAINGARKVSVLSYFEPLPDGVWRFYNGNSIIKTIQYSLGIEKQ